MNNNLFYEAPKSSYKLKYIVVNVKETKMNFPYLVMVPHVCYVTKNNPKTFNGFIRALVVSLIKNNTLTLALVLKYSLDFDELSN